MICLQVAIYSQQLSVLLQQRQRSALKAKCIADKALWHVLIDEQAVRFVDPVRMCVPTSSRLQAL